MSIGRKSWLAQVACDSRNKVVPSKIGAVAWVKRVRRRLWVGGGGGGLRGMPSMTEIQ